MVLAGLGAAQGRGVGGGGDLGRGRAGRLARARRPGRRSEPPEPLPVWAVPVAVPRRPRPERALAAVAAAAATAVAAAAVDDLGVHDDAAPAAVLALLGEDLDQAGPDPLAGHLHQAERGDLGDLVLGAVAPEALEQAAHDEVAVALEHHVDEVDDDDAADVAQPQLADDLLGGLEVVLGDGLLEVAPGADELAGVDVDDGHRLGAVDDQRAARGQPHLAVHRLGERLVDAVRGEDVLLGGPALQARREVGRDVLDVLADLAPGLVAGDDERGEVLGEHVADDAHGQVGLAVQQRRGAAAAGLLGAGRLGLGLDLVPDLGEPLDVGAQLLLARRPRRRCAR